MERARIPSVGKFYVPFYDALENYEWVDEFLNMLSIRDKISNLKNEKKRILNETPIKRDFLESARKSFEAFQERRRVFLKNYIQQLKSFKDPFRRIEYGGAGLYRLGPQLTLEDIEAAADMVDWPDSEDTLCREERERAVEDILGQVAELEETLASMTGSYFIFNNAVITMDAREKFVDFWRAEQSGCREKIGPQGYALAESEPAEQTAYEKLEIWRSLGGNSPRYAALR